MAHEITNTDNMFSVREMPWHGLGAVLPEHPSREEAQSIAHPWEPVEDVVYTRQVTVGEHGPVEEYVPLDTHKLIVRSDNHQPLGVVNDTYGIVKNSELWDVAEAVGSIGSDIEIETAGSLEGGRKVWALLKLAEPFTIKGDPQGETLAYLALQNAHNASAAFRAQAINTRIVCANTSAAADTEAKRNGYEFTFKHSKNVKDRIDDAKAAVAMWREGVDQWRQAMEHLTTVRVSDAQRETFVQQFQPMPPERLTTDRVRGNVERAREELRTILHSQTQIDISHTAYGLVQASLEWMQHERAVRGKDSRGRMESRFKRSMINLDDFGADVIELAQTAALA